MKEEFQQGAQTKTDLEKLRVDFEQLHDAKENKAAELNQKLEKQAEVLKKYEEQAKESDAEVKTLGLLADEKEERILDLEAQLREKGHAISSWEQNGVEKYLASEDYQDELLEMKADYFYSGVGRNLELMHFLGLLDQVAVDKYIVAMRDKAFLKTFPPNPVELEVGGGGEETEDP